jgi:hypothetical protein
MNILLVLWSGLVASATPPQQSFYVVKMDHDKTKVAGNLAESDVLPSKEDWIMEQIKAAKAGMDEAHSSLSGSVNDGATKIVAFPEFAFRPPNSAYTFDEWRRILTALKDHAKNTKFADFLFIYGTILMYDKEQYAKLRQEGTSYGDRHGVDKSKWVRKFKNHSSWARARNDILTRRESAAESAKTAHAGDSAVWSGNEAKQLFNAELSNLKHYHVWNVLCAQEGGQESIKFVTKVNKARDDFPLAQLDGDFRSRGIFGGANLFDVSRKKNAAQSVDKFAQTLLDDTPVLIFSQVNYENADRITQDFAGLASWAGPDYTMVRFLGGQIYWQRNAHAGVHFWFNLLLFGAKLLFGYLSPGAHDPHRISLFLGGSHHAVGDEVSGDYILPTLMQKLRSFWGEQSCLDLLCFCIFTLRIAI